MKSKQSPAGSIDRLVAIRNHYDATSSLEKLDLLRSLEAAGLKSPSDLDRLHAALCFVRAFPDSREHYRCAETQLTTFQERVAALPAAARDQLWDTGIAGTQIHYRFSYEVAIWLADHAPGSVSIDWQEIDDLSRLEELLELLMQACEVDHFHSGAVSSGEWLGQMTAGTARTDFDWLLGQLRDGRLYPIWAQMYNAIDLPLTWRLSGAGNSTTCNNLPVHRVSPRADGMRKAGRDTKSEIMRPLESMKKLSRRAGAAMIDVAMASLALRHRETFHFSYANPAEVYSADVGEGVSIVVFGMRHEHRYPLECTMGYLILSNGVPIGYGGASALFRQINTGVNIFDEYRGSEAAFLWVQVMRVYHHLTGCNRFIANPYQFGGDNPEALKSGAFWFYYKIGYRPVEPAVRELAQRECHRRRRYGAGRSDLPTLKRLASCDMHLTLPGARAGELFEEDWIETSSMLATAVLAAVDGETSDAAAAKVGSSVARDVGLRGTSRWSAARQHAYRQLAPIVAATKPADWPDAARDSLRSLLRAKGGPYEADYARLLGEQEFFFKLLKRACRGASQGNSVD